MKTMMLSALFLLLTVWGFSLGDINIAYSPYTISQPGSYIVVKDLTTAQNLNCITITTSNISLDLNGHTLYGAGTTVGTLGDGILGTTGKSTTDNISICNGIIRNFRQSGIVLSGNNIILTNLQIISNKSTGISLTLAGIIKDNIVYGNGSTGIEAGSGSIVTGNNVQSNGGNGIYGGVACLIKDNICRLNKMDGIQVNTENQVIGNECNVNQANGIHVLSNENSVIGNYCTLNGLGILSETSGNYFEQNKLHNTGNENLNGSQEGAGTLADVAF